ncbi:dymeclin-like isoform X2 [Rhopilema esculentum]|uniref:dymeclin-like isoform X2 n=1 Tax=Rhopilema esculentum TaxID=499914 RepID=UPI0031CE5A8A
MGAESSTVAEIDSNKFINELVGSTKKERDDEFWEELLNFTFEAPDDRDGSKYLEEAVESVCKKIASNNHVTGNFTTLVGVFIFHVQSLIINPQKQKSLEDCQRAWNALLLIRCVCKYMVNSLPEQELIRQFNTLPSCEGTRTVFEEFLLACCQIICEIPVTSKTYYLHLESLNVLIVLLSVQMQELRPTTSSVIHLLIMNSKCSQNAGKIIQKLFESYIKNDLLPSEEDGSGFFSRTLSTVWSMFGGGDDLDPDVLRPLANHSLLLLLILPNQLTKDANKYRGAMFSCEGQKSSVKNQSSKDKDSAEFGGLLLNFNRLYSCLCRDLSLDQTVLLLYLMFHQNESFMNHILKRDDLGNLIVPLLETLYHAEERNSHLTYMTLIVMLILSQEERFSVQTHNTILPEVPWYTERSLRDVSLGDLVLLVLIRMVQRNIFKMRDKYLHTNCLATLANMSVNFHNLGCYVCDRFFRVLAQLLKRYKKMSKSVISLKENDQDEFADSNVLEEIIRMFLEILNSCVVTRLKENPNLVYTLLHEKETIEELETNPKFQDIMFNVLAYFNSRLEKYTDDSLSVESVHDVIRKELGSLPVDQFKKFPELRFKYMEEDNPEEFFVPYVWSLVYKSSYIYWDLKKVTLFQLSPPKES